MRSLVLCVLTMVLAAPTARLHCSPSRRTGGPRCCTDNAYRLAKTHKLKTAFGTDIQFNPKGAEREPYYLPKLTRWFTPAEVLKMATSDNAELLALSGPRTVSRKAGRRRTARTGRSAARRW